jgi:hypothetical protein
MTYLFDTNTCIGWLRLSQPMQVNRIKQERPTDIVLCSVVVGRHAQRSGRMGHGRVNGYEEVDCLPQCGDIREIPKCPCAQVLCYYFRWPALPPAARFQPLFADLSF